MTRLLADLHRHLDGSLRPSTLEELAEERGFTVPDTLLFYPGMGLAEALDRFALTLSVLQEPDEVKRVADEICADAAEEGVTSLEIRFAPQLHRGAPIETIIDAAIDGAHGRAGIILCGLYGEPLNTLSSLVAAAQSRPGVVGIDLAGGPSPADSLSLTDYAEVFTRARELGLGRTVHAGEGRPPAEIRVAIEQLHAQRIGHGTTLLEDPAVVDLVRDRNVTIEACVTSNWHTGVIKSIDEHPIGRWVTEEIRVTICTDNTLLSDVNAQEEHDLVLSIPGVDERTLERCIQVGHESVF